MASPSRLAGWLPSLPVLDWGRRYDRSTLVSDLVAALIVTIMLIPQSLAYALLAGLPPEVGLYASVAPLLLYAVFGTSRVLAVGPVAVVSLMTAAVAVTAARTCQGPRAAQRTETTVKATPGAENCFGARQTFV